MDTVMPQVDAALITIDLADTQKNIEFDVYNSQFKEGASEWLIPIMNEAEYSSTLSLP